MKLQNHNVGFLEQNMSQSLEILGTSVPFHIHSLYSLVTWNLFKNVQGPSALWPLGCNHQ